MTLVRVNETDSGGEFSILNLQMITRADCRKFDRGKTNTTRRCSSPTVVA